ncbi:MAG: hypothetical protein J5965_07660 [Aeriscardovia sp.]|nr:hypothetical protein [Aeriscardovia sp.]
MRIKKYLCAALAIAGLMTSADVSAQESTDATRWKGNEYTQLLTGSGTEVFLYNVGTGRFLIHGGDWGVQARFLYDDTGKLLTIKKGKTGSNVIFDTGMSTNGAAVLGCNIPKVSDSHGWDYGDGTFTILMDAHEDIAENGSAPYRDWKFIRVTDDDESGNYTYYLCEDFTGKAAGDSVVYMGAAYGETWGNHEDNPNGKLVFLAYDRAVWTTMNPADPNATCVSGVWNAEMEGLPAGTTTVTRGMETEVPIFNVDTKVKLKKLYQWRIVTKQEVLARLATGDILDGLSTNLTYLLNDRGFERNDWSFFNTTNGWVENRLSGGNYSTTGRYKYTWGFTGSQTSTGGSKTQHRTQTAVDEPWNKPLRLKAQWDSKENAKYGYLEFEGLGTVSTGIKVSGLTTADPILAPGIYKVSCYGFYQNGGSADHPAYFFVSTKSPSSITANESDSETFKKIALKQISGYSKATGGTSTTTSKTGVMGAGSDFVWAKDPYYVELEIRVEEGQTLYFGLYKNQTARSSQQGSYWDGYGYYDMDWAGADQFQLYYLGTDDPVLFDEDKTGPFVASDYLGDYNYENRTIRLHRKFQKNKWNSFVFPMDLTAVQVRNAFGDDARVAELKGIGVADLSNNADIIDFASVPLGSENKAIEKGKMYLVMPTKEPTAGVASTNNKDYYTLGAASSVKGSDLDVVTMDATSYSPAAGSKNADGHNNIKIDGTFFSSLDYENTSAGNKYPDKTGAYVPAGSYVMGLKNNVYAMYYTQSDLKTKGFRAWVVDLEAQGAKSFVIAFNGVYDETDGIDYLLDDNATTIIPQNGNTFDLSGRKVAVDANQLGTLPKGIYIVNGKKYIVK